MELSVHAHHRAVIDALAAGNTAILKPSAYSAHTTALISRMIQECFDEKYVAVVTGGREENNFLLNEHFDYIFFTGSQEVGEGSDAACFQPSDSNHP